MTFVGVLLFCLGFRLFCGFFYGVFFWLVLFHFGFVSFVVVGFLNKTNGGIEDLKSMQSILAALLFRTDLP